MGDELRIMLERPRPGGNAGEAEEQIIRHTRTSFDGKLQTLAAWQANAKREIVVRLAAMNEEEATPISVDVTAAIL